MTAPGVAADTRGVLCAGEHQAIAETRSLLPLEPRDVTEPSSTSVVARLLGTPVTAVARHDDAMYVAAPQVGFTWRPASPRVDLRHVGRAAETV